MCPKPKAKILIINPNSDPDMSKKIQKTAADYLQGRVSLRVLTNFQAPRFIETYEDIAAACPGLMGLVETEAENHDAIVIACHYDLGLEASQAICSKPVIGIGEASLRMASLLGHNFSLLTTDKHSIPLHEELIHKYGVWQLCASIRAPETRENGLPDQEKYLRLAQRACSQDRAEVLVLGCAGLSGLDKFLQARLERPVLDGIACALSLAEGLAVYFYTYSSNGKGNQHDAQDQ